ncbi:MAG: hypothetical protein IKE41_01820, partial [Clostridia bacterium]|nr:hypothetical protein [Clostridia bacterium]
MKKHFKTLTSLVLACGMLFNISVSAVRPEILQDFTNTFKGKAALDEDFVDPIKFPMADAEQILQKMTSIFKKYPNIANKL